MDDKQREQARLRKQKQRDKERGESVTLGSVTSDSVTMVPASYVQGLNSRMYEVLPERSRYLTLSDDQVLDRANQPLGHTSGDRILRMQACNESSYNFKPHKNPKALAKVKELIT